MLVNNDHVFTKIEIIKGEILIVCSENGSLTISSCWNNIHYII